MAKVDYAALAPQLLDKVGGKANIRSLSHCATRMRFVLKDESVARTSEIKALDGVVTVVQSGGQYQVVIGNDVPVLFEEVERITGGASSDASDEGPRGSLLDRFIKLISALINPVIWTLAGSGLIKAFLALFTMLGWMSAESTTYIILNAAGDAIFYFLPVALGLTSARYFKANELTSVALAGALVYPSIVALNDAGAPVSFLGMPVVMASYTSSLIPIIIAVWAQSHLERWLRKILPSAIRNFMVPLIVLVVMVPLTLMTVGPVTTYISQAISNSVAWLFQTAPWAAGALMGAFWQVLVIFGVHWGFVPFMLNDIADPGYSLMMAPLMPAVLAQGAVMLAVAIRTRNAKLRGVAGPAAVSALLAGITEPGIYGVNLPLKKPFVYGCVSGAVGGAIVAIGGSAANAFVFPSLIGTPAYIQQGNATLFFVGTGVAMLLGFVLTMVLGFKDPVEDEAPAKAADQEATVAPAAVSDVDVLVSSPVAGRVITLEDIPDPVFSSGVMGQGVGIIPTDGQVLSPVNGEVVVTVASKHAVGLKTDDGVEVLVHVGIDTVSMGGQGFTCHVEKGQRVQAGELLLTADLAAVEAAGHSTVTALLVTNSANHKAVTSPATGKDVSSGETLLVVSK